MFFLYKAEWPYWIISFNPSRSTQLLQMCKLDFRYFAAWKGRQREGESRPVKEPPPQKKEVKIQKNNWKDPFFWYAPVVEHVAKKKHGSVCTCIHTFIQDLSLYFLWHSLICLFSTLPFSPLRFLTRMTYSMPLHCPSWLAAWIVLFPMLFLRKFHQTCGKQGRKKGRRHTFVKTLDFVSLCFHFVEVVQPT